MSSPSASLMNSAMHPAINFSPEAITELSSTSDLTSTDEYYIRDNVRQYHHTHQRMLSTIPESVNRLSNQFSVVSDGEDDDIELDYDEVKKVTKIASFQEKHVLPRPALERHGSDSLSGNARPGVLPRKFSQANLASSPLNMIPGVVYPKSRMRSLSSSSLSLSSPFAPLKGSGLSNEAAVQPKAYSSPEVPKPKPAKSLLTEMIAAKKPVMDNPFLTEFAGVTGQGELAPLALKLYLPHSSEPTVPLSVLVRREATVESVIGFALYTYYDQHKLPPLTPEQSRTSHWTMRIVEDDGSIDEDFPALERSRQIEKFAFDQFALCEVSPAQAKANELAQTKAQASRETSSIAPPRQQLSGRKPPIALPVVDSPLAHNSKTATPLTLDNNISLASSDNGPLQMIKIQLLNQVGVLHTTTLNVAATTSLNAMKAAVCRKWNLPPENYDLTSSQARHALDRNATLEGLLGITELSLVPHSHVDPQLLHSQSSMSHDELLGPLTIANLTFIYRHYTVYRRMPMFVNKQERMLAIDGYYLHILPPSVRGGSAGVSGGGGFGNSIGAYSSTKTSSYHIGSMELCRQGRKIKRRFKLVFLRSHDTKTYDFEATTQEESDEICSNLNLLLSTYRGEKLSLLPLPSN
ncbi:Component of a membrane-bound complex containing the Tor2p kinase [Entomophthora muscae]|uniref:Component of a membrane-bound complex containing the Tor2p kinase n=1 Tax=Entomophthora muscae TaxID=34485 RepID=A0ACC2T2X0_9FUNG|nr:Component of a membrane-bound complex containing the Tor2p kinase [Entomophthora muscae]